MSTQCTALNVSDESRCQAIATSVNGLFCFYHSRQCQGLYRGYKNRNARLDSLEAKPPAYLAASSTPLANENFADAVSEETLREIYDYLALRCALLDRVIRARKLHHSRFFSLNLDYGHQNYLDVLSSRRSIVVRALERLERRVGEVLYKKRKWFKWVRQCQDDEETARENEKKKVKKEATLFKRHIRDVQSRMRELRAKEDIQRQEAFLDEAYHARLSEDEQEAEWDPIEDVVEDERGTYVDLIKHILLMTDSVDEAQGPQKPEISADYGMQAQAAQASNAAKPTKKSKKSKAKALTTGSSVPSTSGSEIALPDKLAHDTQSQIRQRLKEGVRLSYGIGMHVAGSIDNPVETHDKTAPIPDEEIDQLLQNMCEVKSLLFCRLVLSHATVLPAAIKANSIDEFLSDPDVSNTDLRDLALKLDEPGLQEIRDACADLGRGEEKEDDDVYEESEEEPDNESRTLERLKKLGLSSKKGRRTTDMPDTWAPEREKRVTEEKKERQSLVEHTTSLFNQSEEPKAATMIDFGELDDEGKFKSKKMRVKVCGKYIYNYPSERAISRGGWLQFCLIAKDSDLHDAIKLCRHWDEFFDLNILANFQYFPAARWLVWKGDRTRQQLLQLGVIPYQQFEGAADLSTHFQTGSRGQGARAHNIREVRNWMCANVKRNDPATRRFLQYLTMQSAKVLVLIRDAKTSKILSSPPADQLWLDRKKSGIGRASKNEWNVGLEIGPTFFDKMESTRRWHFGFNEYYDVYIWNLEPGQPWPYLYNIIYETLFKAHRFCSMQDLYNPAAPTLKTLTRDRVTFRTRDLKLGEDTPSIWDDIQHGGRGHMLNPEGRTLETQIAPDPHASKFYNEADVLEDAILFPEELAAESSKALFSRKGDAIERYQKKGPDWESFINDYDTDEESDNLLGDGSDKEDHLLEEGTEDDDSSLAESEEPTNPIVDKSEDDGTESSSNGEDTQLTAPKFKDLFSEEERQDWAVMQGWRPEKEYGTDVESEFWTFMDREKSKAFKQSWHAADLNPQGPERYQQTNILVKQMAKYLYSTTERFRDLRILRFMNVHPDTNRRVGADMRDARAMAALFFRPRFFTSEYGILHKDSPIVNQKERALKPPSRRPSTSNKYQPKDFFEEWDTHHKTHSGSDYTVEWDVVIRPIVARLYKAGVIGHAYLPRYHVPGDAMAARRPDGERDFYIDFRCVINEITIPSTTKQPPSKEYVFTTLHKWSKEHPRARFAALRLWSAPHFWPLMIGLDRRNGSAFVDALGRAWEWNFIPKDLPYSELSIHNTVTQRLAPFKQQFKNRVIHIKDLILVMGTDDEEDLFHYTTATIFALQTNPWRFEVDLWRSFINVDMDFLEYLDGLKAGWLD